MEDFDFVFNPAIPAGIIRDLAGLGFLHAGQSVILHGPVGVGKTMLAQALGQIACRRGHNVVFTKTSRLLADLAGGHADRTWNTRLRRWAHPALLSCDDFAMRELTLPQADDLYELITERAGRSIIATSNRTPADWYPLFPNPVVAESILDRLVNSAHHAPMPGHSYRPQHRPTTPAHVGTDASERNGRPRPEDLRSDRLPQPVTRNPRGRPRLYCSSACRAESPPPARPRRRSPPARRSRPRLHQQPRSPRRQHLARATPPRPAPDYRRHRPGPALRRIPRQTDPRSHRPATTSNPSPDPVDTPPRTTRGNT